MTDQQENSERLFIQQASALLEERADGLDAATRSRLNRARQAALDELDASQGLFGRHKFWAPAGGLVVASLFTAMVWVGGLQMGSQNLRGTMPAAIEVNADLLTVDEDFELLAELEFYNWLQSVPGGSV